MAGASRIYPGLPPHGRRQRIGLMGGSFNPAHEGHRHITLMALNRLQLDRVWWLVTPGNPLKPRSGLPELALRMERAGEVARHPRVAISGAECVFGTVYTADLVRVLRRAAPTAQFVWIMGSDNLRQFNRWGRWREIAAALPIVVVNRPGSLMAPLSAPAAQALRAWRIDEADAALLPALPAPVWCTLTGPRSDLSSTALRARAVS